jgi:chaperonin GroEL
MNVEILFKQEAQKKLYEGAAELAEAVSATLGPVGHTVIIDKGYGIPHVTKDGVTVARAYDTSDPMKRMGATLVKTVAAKTCDEAGDGTTTATILATALMMEGMEVMPSIKNPQMFKKGIETAKDRAVDFIQQMSTPIEEGEFDRVLQIATISANGDKEIGTIISEAIGKVSNDGVITVEESSKTDETTVEVTTGFQYEKGLVNPYFVTDPERMECVLDKPYVLVFGQNINYVQEILPIVQTVYSAKRGLLIIAPNMTNDVIKFLVMNVQQTNGLKACFVKAPGYGQIQKDLIEDLAIKLGAQVIGDEYGHPVEQTASSSTEWLGECDRAVITTTRTVIIGGSGSDKDINTRVEAIKHLMDGVTNAYDIEKYKERISKLTGGAAVVYVGAKSEVEMKERKDRVDDAIAATRAAIEEGYVPGGGTMHFRAAEMLDEYLRGTVCPDDSDFRAGVVIVREALQAPFRQLCENAGLKPDKIEVLIANKPNWMEGFNPVKEEVTDMFQAGIIDPTKVARVTLENAVSVAIQFLNTSCAMAAKSDKDEK